MKLSPRYSSIAGFTSFEIVI